MVNRNFCSRAYAQEPKPRMNNQTEKSSQRSESAETKSSKQFLFTYVGFQTLWVLTLSRSTLTHNREPQEVATIKVKDKAFKVHKALLVKDSEYFERALNGPFVEGQTQTVVLGDDVCPVQFGIYVDVLYRSYVIERYKFKTVQSNVYKHPLGGQILWLWRLSDRFLNKYLLKIAEESFSDYMKKYTVTAWETIYQNRVITEDRLRLVVKTLEFLYQQCIDYNLPQKDDLAGAAANMPLQLLAKYHDDLDVHFRTAVMKKLTKRFENPNLKRPIDLMEEDSPPNKRDRKS